MLTKAILTGGVLSLLAGSIVYFGTEGADAMDLGSESSKVFDLSGDTTSTVKSSEAETDNLAGSAEMSPPKDETKPKTRWLDQYLKASKPQAKPKPEAEEKQSDENDRGDARDEAKGTYVVSEEPRDETVGAHDDRPETNEFAGDAQGDFSEVFGLVSSRKDVDYDRVLAEVEKLLVVDMRNEALLEIVDYAVSRGDMEKAAQIGRNLSSPELRDTARARIGKGLALRGDAESAFAIIEDIEIDELAAPIRLEIIAALMMTPEERLEASVFGRMNR
jgi:hypothetical protein